MILLIGAIVAGLVLLVAAAGSGSGSTVTEEMLYEGGTGKIAVIRLEGTIAEADSSSTLFTTTYATPENINEQLDNALNDDDVKGVLLRVNSPGGEVIASDLIYRKVKEVRTVKPVVTWMSSLGASGAYMISSASDKIIAHPETFTGSIGVIMELSDITGLYEKLGIKTRTFKSGEYKDSTGVFDDDPNGVDDQIFQDLIDESYEAFILQVAEDRGMTVDEVRVLADGRIYSGTQAAANGLIDAVGYEEDAIAAIEELSGESDLTVVEYSTGGFWGELYQYEQTLLNKYGLLSRPEPLGATMYYLMDV